MLAIKNNNKSITQTMDSKRNYGYTSPRLSLMAFRVEDGFASSTENQWFNSEKNSVNVGWGYSSDDETWG